MKIRRLVPVAFAALLLVPLSACSASSESLSMADTASIGVIEPAVDGAFTPGIEQSLTPAAEGRSVIRSGDLALEVEDPAESAAQVAEVVDDLGGYVESESLQTRDGGPATGAYLTLRVPADRLDEAFDELGKLGNTISQSRSAMDVTAQHVDLQARVEALEASVERLTELMAGSATTGELIEAETALSQRQQELDGLRAQLEALEGQVEQASISVSLSTTSTLPGGPDNFWDGLVAGWNSLAAAGAGALVLLGILLPWLVLAAVIAIAVVLIVRAARRSRRTPPSTSAAWVPAPDQGPAPDLPAQQSNGSVSAPVSAPLSAETQPGSDHPDRG